MYLLQNRIDYSTTSVCVFFIFRINSLVFKEKSLDSGGSLPTYFKGTVDSVQVACKYSRASIVLLVPLVDEAAEKTKTALCLLWLCTGPCCIKAAIPSMIIKIGSNK